MKSHLSRLWKETEMMNGKLFIVDEKCKIRAHSLAKARRKYDELITRSPLLNLPANLITDHPPDESELSRLREAIARQPDRSNVNAMVRIREATEQEVRDAEATDGPPPEETA
jgi:hypothetical protein